MCVAFQANTLQRSGNHGDLVAPRHAGQPECDIAAHVQMGEQEIVLHHIPHTATPGRQIDLRFMVEEHLLVERDAARIRRFQPGNAGQRHALARAGLAQQRGDARRR